MGSQFVNPIIKGIYFVNPIIKGIYFVNPIIKGIYFVNPIIKGIYTADLFCLLLSILPIKVNSTGYFGNSFSLKNVLIGHAHSIPNYAIMWGI